MITILVLAVVYSHVRISVMQQILFIILATYSPFYSEAQPNGKKV